MACAGQLLGRGHVAQHEEPGDVHPELAGPGDVLRGDVALGAVGRDPHRADAEVVGALEVRGGADAGQQQGREPGVGESPGGRRDPFVVGVRRSRS